MRGRVEAGEGREYHCRQKSRSSREKKTQQTHALQLTEPRHRVEVGCRAQDGWSDTYCDVFRRHLGVCNREPAKEANEFREEPGVAARQRCHRAAATACALPPELRSNARRTAATARDERLQRDER